MDTVGLGVVGLGAVWQCRHRPSLTALDQADIRIVADVDQALAEGEADELGCRWATDYQDVLAGDSVDAVLICVPPFLHEEVAVAAARAGKHILCEKPLAPTVAAADAIVRAADGAGVVLMVAENWLFDPLTAAVRSYVRDGRFGRLRRIRFMQSWCGPDKARFYHSPVPGRNGVLLEDGIHMIAMARWLLGEPTSVTGVTRTVEPLRRLGTDTVESRVEDEATVTMEFEGAMAVGEMTWLVDVGGLHSEFLFEQATIVVNNPGWDRLLVSAVCRGEDGAILPLDLPGLGARAPVSQQSYIGEDKAFLQSLLDGTPVPYPGSSAREDVRIMELAYESAACGRTVAGPARE